MKPKTYIIIALLTFLSGCTKDDSQKLPPATQIGANTFGCKINGVIYECNGYRDGSSVISFGGIYYGFYDSGFIEIDTSCNSNHKNALTGVFISFKFEGKLGIYKDIKNVKKGSDSYVNVTRYDNGTLSGTFQIVKEYSSGEIVYFTEGRFDIQKPKK